jgi:hypothetical protein
VKKNVVTIERMKEVKLPCPWGTSEAFIDAIAILCYLKSETYEGYLITDTRKIENIINGEYSDEEIKLCIQPSPEAALKDVLHDLEERWAWISVGEACHFCKNKKKCVELIKTLLL